MVNEDILTSLKNAVARGESLDNAMETAMNSGYNSREVEEASRYIGVGVVNLEKLGQERMLTMPNQKGRFSFFSKKPTGPSQLVSIQPVPKPESNSSSRLQTPKNELSYSSIPIPQQKSAQVQMSAPQIQKIQSQPQPIRIQPMPLVAPSPQIQQIKENISPPRPQSQPVPLQNYPIKRTAPKQSYAKEIILLIMLLVLAGILIITFRYRDQIIAFFSG
jgi:hypothetical protein